MDETIAKLRDLLLSQSKAGRLRSLLDSIYGAAQTGAEAYGSASQPLSQNQAGMLGGMIADFTPVVGDVKSAYEGVQSARQGDYIGAGLGALGALPMVPNLAGVIAKGNFPEFLYRGTNGSAERIKGGIGEGLLFATPQERVAKMYGHNIERIGVNPDANILIEGSKEFADATGRRRGKIINNMRKGENMKTAADDVIKRAKALGFDAVDFNSMEDLGTAIINQSKFRRWQ